MRRLRAELVAESERWRAPLRARAFDEAALLHVFGRPTIESLWTALASRPYAMAGLSNVAADLDSVCPGDKSVLEAAADRAARRTVDLLGSGPIPLGVPIDWHADFKSGHRWPVQFARRISYLDPDRPNDVKVPWELSRHQWLIPAAQCYVLTKDERYASAVRDVLGEWIAANPYAMGVNWSVTMEVALRILVWTFFFHVFKESSSWGDSSFRSRFLRALFLHVEFTRRNLELSDVNGNHLDADAAGLVFGGLFFGGTTGERWADHGWRILGDELPRQIADDGVDFEGSTAYHRLVAELFLLPALYRLRLGHPVDETYVDGLARMARFVSAYTPPDGLSPLWGDSDDGRALPLGTQPLRDHRYLIGLIGRAFGLSDLIDAASGPRGETFWLLGHAAARDIPIERRTSPRSEAFSTSGVYVMRTKDDYVFVDAGPVGMRGRGGHGHNDCLSFDLVLDGTRLVADPGSFVYTASYELRNRFRGTASHNTPIADGEEQNRFIDPSYLWSLHFDAVPRVISWSSSPGRDRLVASHSGYARLQPPLELTRMMALDLKSHRFVVEDRFASAGPHNLVVPLHFDPGVGLVREEQEWRLRTNQGEFRLVWAGEGAWLCDAYDSWYSPSYGVRLPTKSLEFRCFEAAASLTVVIGPASQPTSELLRWRDDVRGHAQQA